jgi:hypothetical protein
VGFSKLPKRRIPRVAAARQPWAALRNRFAVKTKTATKLHATTGRNATGRPWPVKKDAGWATFSVENIRVALLRSQSPAWEPNAGSWICRFASTLRGKGFTMFRTAIGLSILAVLSVATGCTMCCHPYDNCGPVYNGDRCQSCDTRARAGSVFAGTATAETATVSESNQTPTPAKPPKAVQPTPAPVTMPGKTAAAIPSKRPTRSQSASFAVKGGQVSGQVQGHARPGDVPGSEKIVSVTDRVVEPSNNATATLQAADGPAIEPSRLPTSQSQGWVARRPSW